MTTTNETLTNEATRKLFKSFLTGNDEADAKKLQRSFRGARLTLAQWRQVVAESK